MRILEIGDYRLMREGFPGEVDHWSTTPPEHFRSDGPNERLVTFAALPKIKRALRSNDYALVVVQPGAFRPWQWQAVSRALFRRSALKGNVPYARYFGQGLVTGKVTAPIAVWDWDDTPLVASQNAFLLDAATLYFKRELPADHWRVFMGTLHRGVPTPRMRRDENLRARIAKLRPISLGIPLGRDVHPAASPVTDAEKTTDVFFTGRVAGSSTVRERGLAELQALRDRGYRIDIPQNSLSLDAFLRRCAQAWLTWSPEGYGYDCFRTYEASLCGSVPVLNRSPLDAHKPLRHGEHCLYYDVEPGGLTATLTRALDDRAKLSAMAHAARDFVLTHHTHAALARHIAEETLRAGKR